MPIRNLHVAPVAPALPTVDPVLTALAVLRAEMEIPAEFPPGVVEEASAAAQVGVSAGREDLRDVPFVTIDPPGSMDL
ncbi:MAG: ribonuclease, partial [Oerskovia sp.]|nr:ribonuclease [Oerskovia sp.]